MTGKKDKLGWYKSLRGADLTPTQGWLLTLLSTYTNEGGGNAHPGIDRLMADSGLGKRQVHKTLRELEGKGAIAVVRKGGGRLSGSVRGAATVYCILVPQQRSNGAESDTVNGAESDTVDDALTVHFEDLTVHSDPLNGALWDTPSGPKASGPINHHSDSDESGAAASQQHHRSGVLLGTDDGNDDDEKQDQKRLNEKEVVDLGVIEDKLAAELGLSPAEMTKVDALLQKGCSENFVRNTILRDRKLRKAS